MHRRYGKNEDQWLDGLRQAKAFIAGPLYQHVSTWPRYGQLGVQECLNCDELCARLPRVLDQRGKFMLVFDADEKSAQLLVIEVGPESHPIALCYGPWPGISVWEAEIQPALSPGLPLPRTFWNRMPRLEDFGAPARDQPQATVVERRRAWLDDGAASPVGFGTPRRALEAIAP